MLDAPTVHGVLRALGDPYTQYLGPAAYERLLAERAEQLLRRRVGCSRRAGGLLVTITLPGMPGSKGGVRAGDLIVAIDGRRLRGVSYESAVELLHGAPARP